MVFLADENRALSRFRERIVDLLAQLDRQDRASIKRVHPLHEIRNLDIRVTIVQGGAPAAAAIKRVGFIE